MSLADQLDDDRRRTPRFDVTGGEKGLLPIGSSVRILDISASGVLVESKHPVREGVRGRLRMDFGGRPFSAEIEVRRVSSSATRDRFQIGAAFIGLSPEHAQTIARLTTR